MTVERISMAESNMKKPVYYESDSQRIYDAEDNFILDIMGWGRIQYLPGGAEIQDCIGEYICECINSARHEAMLID